MASGFLVEVAVEKINEEKGKGIVAKQDIPKGTLIWTGKDARVQVELSEEDLEKRLDALANDKERAFFMSHAYCFEGKLYELKGNFTSESILCYSFRQAFFRFCVCFMFVHVLGGGLDCCELGSLVSTNFRFRHFNVYKPFFGSEYLFRR